MNNATHTPGPWVIRYKDAVYAQCGRFIADCELTPYDARPQPPNSTDAANAHLIAAAPAMYEALQDAYEKLCYLAPDKFDDEEHAANWQRDLSTMLAALAQAEGAQHE